MSRTTDWNRVKKRNLLRRRYERVGDDPVVGIRHALARPAVNLESRGAPSWCGSANRYKKNKITLASHA